MHNSTKSLEFNALLHILYYFKGILGKGILFNIREYLIHEAYIDINYAMSMIDKIEC